MIALFLIITVFAFYRLQSQMLTFRFPSKYFFLAYAFLYLLYFIQGNVSEWFPQLPLKFLFIILSMAYPVFLYKDRLSKRIFWSLLPWFMNAIIEMATMFFFVFGLKIDAELFVVTSPYQTLGSLISTLTLLAAAEILLHLLKRQESSISYFRLEIVTLLGINILFMATVAGLFYYNNQFLSVESALSLMFSSFTLMSIVTVLILYKVAKKSQEITQNKLQMQTIEMETRLTDNLVDVTTNLRNLRHDMNNHFGILQGLLSLSEYDEASAYLDSILESLKVANNFVFTDNKKLSVLINSKVSKSNTLNIPIEAEIHTNDFPMDDQDLCALIGNVLENAIEASTQAEHPAISFSIEKEDSNCVIRCANSFSVEPIFCNGELPTTKTDKEIHGIGTQIIKSIARKYHGEAEFAVDEQFRVTVRIPYQL